MILCFIHSFETKEQVIPFDHPLPQVSKIMGGKVVLPQTQSKTLARLFFLLFSWSNS